MQRYVFLGIVGLWLAAVQGTWGGRTARADAAAETSTATVAHSPQRYDLKAVLDPIRHQVRGQVRIEFTNTSTQALKALVFHQYLNAFRDQNSVFMRESNGSSRGQRLRGKGELVLERLEVDGKDGLTHASAELVKGDFTQLEVPLSEPLEPGKTAHIEADFVAKLPPVFARSGYAADFHCVAQWFPKLAKLEPTGKFESFPYHALGEFYADFADYQLTVSAPADFVVGANGKLKSEARDGDSVVRTYVIKQALDAVFVAGKSLRTEQRTQQNVHVEYVFAEGYDLALEEHAATVEAGLRHFGLLFGPYPYETLTVVVPPRSARGAAGMEYPGLFLTDGFWLPTPGSPGVSGAFVTAHELAHQWFSILLASNEVRFPVLDEGFAQWAALDLLRTQFGEKNALSTFLPLSRFEAERVATWSFGHARAPGEAAPSFTPAEYAASVYSLGAVALETIRRVWGRERFEEMLHAYTAENRYKHPTPEALTLAFDKVYGAGFSDRIVIPLLLRGESVDVRIVEARTRRKAGGGYATTVRARRTGSVPIPTWLAALDAQGRELTRLIFPGENEALFVTLETDEPVAQVVLDPDRAILVDPNVRNQVFTFHTQDRTTWTARLIALGQALIASWGP